MNLFINGFWNISPHRAVEKIIKMMTIYRF